LAPQKSAYMHYIPPHFRCQKYFNRCFLQLKINLVASVNFSKFPVRRSKQRCISFRNLLQPTFRIWFDVFRSTVYRFFVFVWRKQTPRVDRLSSSYRVKLTFFCRPCSRRDSIKRETISLVLGPPPRMRSKDGSTEHGVGGTS
jgi:hypothetical protein